MTHKQKIFARTRSGVIDLDVIYCALGCDVHSDLAARLGCRIDENGFIRTDNHQETSINGVYAIGDVISGLDQVAVTCGQAAVAATAIHRNLAGFS
jgi:thioredoxin reductase (NADPH)